MKTYGLIIAIFSDESIEKAPYDQLPHRYEDQPTSVHAVNTYVGETEDEEPEPKVGI